MRTFDLSVILFFNIFTIVYYDIVFVFDISIQ